MLNTCLRVDHSLRGLITNLTQHANFGHPLDIIEIKETNISCLLLTGEYVYKFKKAVNLGFLDFVELDRRKFYCEEEIRLNSRLAPDLYLEVICITGSYDKPEINGTGDIIEYAVKMRQFQPDSELSRLLNENKFQPAYIDDISKTVADFHDVIQVADRHSPHGEYPVILNTIRENMELLAKLINEDKAHVEKLNSIEAWTRKILSAQKKFISIRKKQGHIKECHGDLHLGNIALYQEKPVIFDCIEFSENLRWIDTMCDVAFLVMDLESHRPPPLAYRFLNDYLEYSGDYEGLNILKFYCVYRALVRAKIYAIGHKYETTTGGRFKLMHQYQSYILLALSYTRPSIPFILITHGCSGSGKTTLARPIADELGIIRIRSDVERKRLRDLKLSASSYSKLMNGLYSANASDKTYQRLADITERLIKADYPVLVDATFLLKKHRQLFKKLASKLEVPFIILDFSADKECLIKRIEARQKQRAEASEADINVLEYQLGSMKPLDPKEEKDTVFINTNSRMEHEAIIDKIKTILSKNIINNISHA